MSDFVRDSVLYNSGVEIHIALDPDKKLYCENRALAQQVVTTLNNLGANAMVGKLTEIKSKINGPIHVFPVRISDAQGNNLVVRVTDDLVLALGINELFRDPQVHHRGIKAIPLKDSKRRSGRRNHSARKK